MDSKIEYVPMSTLNYKKLDIVEGEGYDKQEILGWIREMRPPLPLKIKSAEEKQNFMHRVD